MAKYPPWKVGVPSFLAGLYSVAERMGSRTSTALVKNKI